MTLQSVCTDGSGRARRERDGEPRQSPNPIYRSCDRGIEGRLLERLKSPTQHAPHARSFPVTIQETSSRPSAPSSNGKRSACSSVADRAFLSSFRTNCQRCAGGSSCARCRCGPSRLVQPLRAKRASACEPRRQLAKTTRDARPTRPAVSDSLPKPLRQYPHLGLYCSCSVQADVFTISRSNELYTDGISAREAHRNNRRRQAEHVDRRHEAQVVPKQRTDARVAVEIGTRLRGPLD